MPVLFLEMTLGIGGVVLEIGQFMLVLNGIVNFIIYRFVRSPE